MGFFAQFHKQERRTYWKVRVSGPISATKSKLIVITASTAIYPDGYALATISISFLKDYKRPPFSKSRKVNPIVKPLPSTLESSSAMALGTSVHPFQSAACQRPLAHTPRLLQHVTSRHVGPSFLSILDNLTLRDLIHLPALRFLRLDLQPNTQKEFLLCHLCRRKMRVLRPCMFHGHAQTITWNQLQKDSSALLRSSISSAVTVGISIFPAVSNSENFSGDRTPLATFPSNIIIFYNRGVRSPRTQIMSTITLYSVFGCDLTSMVLRVSILHTLAWTICILLL